MKSIGEILSESSERPSLAKLLSEQIKVAAAMPPDERFIALRNAEERKVERYNAEVGHLNEVDGYNCPECKNRGHIGFIDIDGDANTIHACYPECSCMAIRRSILRMKASGLEKSIRDYTFKRFTIREPWQQKMYDLAQHYLTEGVQDGRWLYIGGQPGCGKTHICTAVAGKLLYERPLLYVVWPQVVKKLNAIVNDAEDFSREMGRLQEINVLYIDDFFKPFKDDMGKVMLPTPAEMKRAFELLNYRYVNKLPTIISSEWHIEELTNMDEATGSRIMERSQGFCMTIGRDRSRNQRLAGATTV